MGRISVGKSLTRIQLAGLVFLVWTAVGVFEAVPEWLQGALWYDWLAKVIDAWAWALLTPPLLLIDRKLASREQSIGTLVTLFLLLSVPFSLIHIYLTGLLLYPIPQVSWNPLINRDYRIFYFLGGWVTYCAAVGSMQAFRYYNRYLTGQLQLERAEKSLVNSRLNALRLHLEPHFLFNALNAISSEVSANPRLARNMIADLGTLLRRSLDCQESAEISLAQELQLLEIYLSIQRARFGDRMDIRIDVAPDLRSAMVPSMLLQPLVENAIRHGIEDRITGGRIGVSAIRTGEWLQIEIVDDGVGLPNDWRLETSVGQGVRVTRERLSALYPECEEQCLTIQRGDDGGTKVTIRMPLPPTGPDRHGNFA